MTMRMIEDDRERDIKHAWLINALYSNFMIGNGEWGRWILVAGALI